MMMVRLAVLARKRIVARGRAKDGNMYDKNIYKEADQAKRERITAFAEEYKAFLSVAKTERLCVREIEAMARAAGYRRLDEASLTPGSGVYFVNKHKNVVLYRLGRKSPVEGLRILGAHLDSPRMDLKQNPLYETGDFAMWDTHYYGGIKKYQYVTIPLAVHGVVCKKDGTTVEVHIGEDPADPVLGISDLLIHLSAEQMQKKGDKLIEGEKLDVIVGSIPLAETEKDAVKANVMKLLTEKYGFDEEDFSSAELEIVPAGAARDFGLDRSMIAAYGHDDRVCAYASLRALLDGETADYTSCALFVDKEEIGSYGATGAESLFFENTVLELLHALGTDDLLSFRRTLENSRMLSSDVNAAIDPIYSAASDKKNGAKFNHGIVYEKYTGARGKSGASDANPEYFAKIRAVMDEKGIYYQTGELGAVDQGGGGTIAFISARYNMEVIDAGVPVLNMHSPMEIVAKADLYETYLAYLAFLGGLN